MHRSAPHPSSRIDTMAAHAGDDPFRFLGAAAPPIFETSTFVFPSFADAVAAFADEQEHCVYTRGRNPTVRVVEEKLAALEGAEACRLFGSGMAAISAAILSCVKAGDHIVAVDTAYGPARAFITGYLSRFGITATLVDGRDPAEWEAAVRPNTALFYLESPSSGVMKLQDVPAVTAIARRHGIATVIDNSYCTMLLQRPLELGVDLVVYSGSKYFGGHSDVLAGAVLGPAERLRRIGDAEYPLLGGIIGPFEAWLVGRGLRTLPVRLRQHQVSAAKVAEFLAGHGRVARVHYPGHPSHPQYELALRQMRGASGLLSFELDTRDLNQVSRFVDALRYFRLGVSWGGYESLVFVPVIGAMRRLPEAQWPNPGLVRIHVGLEDVADLIGDLDQALRAL